MGHGLRHSQDLVAWKKWHESRHVIRHHFRSARARLRPPTDSPCDLLVPGEASDILVAVEATHASFLGAVVSPLTHLVPEKTSILAPAGWQPPAAYFGHKRHRITLDRLSSFIRPRVVLAAGHYTEIGSAAFSIAEGSGATFFVSQHGALTPFAPPLPKLAQLLAWSDEDAHFWTTGRRDVQATAVGSQLLWMARGGTDTGAARSARPAGDPATRLVYLGQGHAAEIPRVRLAHAALTTCREHHAVYRPHPSERDVTSRAVLAAYSRAGITVDTAGTPLVDLEAPVVSVFSTGVLEAAARGREAWVDFPHPPAWLGEFWERYDMHRLGSSPTPAPPVAAQEPAQRIAEIVLEAAS